MASRPHSVNLALAALRTLATEGAAHGGLSPLTGAGIRGVGGARRSGVRTGNWPTLLQGQQLLAAPDPETTKGVRDRVLLGLLVGCGLRRKELAGLEFPDVAQREGRWAIVDLVGKHGRVRTVPMPSWAKTALDAWATAAGSSSGAVLRRVDKGGRVGPGPITAQAVFEAVVSNARQAGLGKITPHDLRRTLAKLAHLGRAPSSRSASAMLRSRPPSAIWGSGRTCTMRLVIGWGWWDGRGRGAGVQKGVIGVCR